VPPKKPGKKSASKSDSSDMFNNFSSFSSNESSVEQPIDTRLAVLDIAEEREKHTPVFFVGLITAVALISAFITFGIAQQIKPTVDSRTTLAAKTSGGVCLSEKELRKLVTEQKVNAYWAGPVSNATYSLNTTSVGQVFVRYVLKGQNCDSETKEFRVIATYAVAGAYDSTKAAGSQSNGVSLANADGSIVYFNKDVPTNVYVAYPGIDYQIEIYDPNPKDAVTIATTPSKIQLIKS
jgi:hypothetical protein